MSDRLYRTEAYTPPGAYPISLAQAKAHLRVSSDVTTDDTLIDFIIRAAVDYVETRTTRRFVSQTMKAYAADWPDGDEWILPEAPLKSVSSITYTDTADATQTVTSTIYDVDTHDSRAIVRLGYGQTWPGNRGHENDVCITYLVGYGTPFTAANATEVLTLAGRTPADTTKVRVWTTDADLPAGFSADTDYYEISSSGQTCKLSLTSGGSAVTISDDGTGTHFLGEQQWPLGMVQAALLLIGHLHENREAGAERALSAVPFALDSLIYQLRV